MKTRISPAVVGAFVLGAFTLGILALLFFGGVRFFHQQQRFIVYFDESIQGLNLGSPVKLQGVGVGRVVALNIRYDRTKNHSVVAVVCEFDRNRMTDVRGGEIDVSSRNELQSLVDHGLRAQLDVVGLATGLLVVELDFMDPAQHPVETLFNDSPYPVVPSVISTISEFQASAIDILTRVRRIDFEGLTNDLKRLLEDARTQVDSVDFKGLTAQWQKAGTAVTAVASSPQIAETFANLNTTLADLRRTLTEVRGTVGKVGTQVDASGRNLQSAQPQAESTLREFTTTAENLRRFIDAQQNLGDDGHKALTQLADAAAAVERLADFLERNPSALISGKKAPP